MARADLLLSLARAGISADNRLMRKTIEAMVAEERAKQHHVLANKLEEIMQSFNVTNFIHPLNKGQGNVSSFDEKLQTLYYELQPQQTLDSLVLPANVTKVCREIIEEQNRSDLLRSYNLEPRNRLLLSGPPGNGKTSLAEAIASELLLPLIVVRYEGVIGSYLGETAQRLRRLFDFVRTRRCVLFFDEFDAIGKERGDIHETGEIKRVVSSLLLQIDDLPTHVVVIAATNHSELLDKAVWRRFQARINLPKPNKRQIAEWFIQSQNRFPEPLGIDPVIIADKLQGLSFAEVQDFCTDILRRYALSLPAANMTRIVQERLEQWSHRSSSAIHKGKEE